MYTAVDFETYYEPKEYSITIQGMHGYVRDPRFKAYMVSMYNPELQYVGPVEDAPWDAIEPTVLAHNATFESLVVDRCKEQGLIPETFNPEWLCTADMSVYLSAPRNLAGASKALLNRKVSKTTRNAMAGIASLTDAKREGIYDDVMEYALQDAEICYLLFEKWGKNWPDTERTISRINREAGHYGVQLDVERLEKGIQTLEQVKFEAAKNIPWDWSNRKTPLSRKELAKECRKAGIPVPSSTAKDSVECQEWEDTYGVKYPWVAAMRDWRRANRLCSLLRTLRDRMDPEGIFRFSKKYFGAHTGRFSGDSGFNMENLNKGDVFDVDLRGMFTHRPGKILTIGDLSQIEPRALNWLCGNFEFLDLCRNGQSPYEAHARVSMGWTGGLLKEEDPKLYSVAKARILALGYGAGWQKFIDMLHMYGVDPFEVFDYDVADADLERFFGFLSKVPTYAEVAKTFPDQDESTRKVWTNAWLQVVDFRASNPKIVALWNDMDSIFREAARAKEKVVEIELPSGRPQLYFNPRIDSDGGLRVQHERGGTFWRTYGGKLTENLTQAVARDIFAEIMIRFHDAGKTLLWTVHDEYILEDDPDVDLQEYLDLVRQEPDWMPGIPLDAEFHKEERYNK